MSLNFLFHIHYHQLMQVHGNTKLAIISTFPNLGVCENLECEQMQSILHVIVIGVNYANH